MHISSLHTCEQPRAKWSGGLESGEHATRKWAWLDLCNSFHFYFTWEKWNTIGQKQERREIQSIIDLLCLTRSNWIPMELVIYHNYFIGNCRQHMEPCRELELSACITDVLTMKVAVYMFLFFRPKREQEIAVESMLMYLSYCWLDRTGVKYYKHTWWQAGNKTTQRCLPVISIIKEQIAEAKCALATVGINFDCFNLWQYFINNRHHACMLLWKKLKIFQRDHTSQGSTLRPIQSHLWLNFTNLWLEKRE